MHVMEVRNVVQAWPRAVRLIKRQGRLMTSRVGEVLVLDDPVVTVYSHPRERVLRCPVRDANPMFHLMEALWMLAGRHDATWLDLFVKDFSERFGEARGLQWGAYGYRWRHHFLQDQLKICIDRLSANRDDRRSVIGMWDPSRDLTEHKCDIYKDYPCNTTIFLRVNHQGDKRTEFNHWTEDQLDITVCCRSNDIVWGCYGANAVHMSMLQEYLAAMIGVNVGIYYQFSNNWHAYTDTLPPEDVPLIHGTANYYSAEEITPDRLIDSPGDFHRDVTEWVAHPDGEERKNRFFNTTAWPMYQAAAMWRVKDKSGAVDVARNIASLDWKLATLEWMQRRM